MKNRGFGVAWIAIWMSACQANAQVAMDGHGLYDACGQTEETWISFCNGYMQAIVDVLEPRRDICIPNGTTRAGIAGAVFEALDREPLLREFNAAIIVEAVVEQTFPCR